MATNDVPHDARDVFTQFDELKSELQVARRGKSPEFGMDPHLRRKLARSRTAKRDELNVTWTERLVLCGGISLIAIAVLMLLAAIPNSPLQQLAGRAGLPVPGETTKAIEDIQVGDRVVGRNPLREQVDESLPDPDPHTWRKLSLVMTKESGSKLWIDLLRDLDWIAAAGASEGETIHLDLPEMGAVGPATVTYLGPCPQIKLGPGVVVTGTFKHEADENSNLVQLQLEGEAKPHGVTDNHPYWSVDRQEFVAAGELHPGELLDTKRGDRRVVSIIPVEYSGYLYNLETHREHVFRVGQLGALVHNSCVIHGKPQFTSPAHAKAMEDMANRMADSGAYSDVYMHSKWSTILKGKGVAVKPDRLPDVAGVRNGGRVDIIEFASSQNDHLRGNLLGRNIEIWEQLPKNLRGDILVYDELGNWTHVYP